MCVCFCVCCVGMYLGLRGSFVGLWCVQPCWLCRCGCPRVCVSLPVCVCVWVWEWRRLLPLSWSPSLSQGVSRGRAQDSGPLISGWLWGPSATPPPQAAVRPLSALVQGLPPVCPARCAELRGGLPAPGPRGLCLATRDLGLHLEAQWHMCTGLAWDLSVEQQVPPGSPGWDGASVSGLCLQGISSSRVGPLGWQPPSCLLE